MKEANSSPPVTAGRTGLRTRWSRGSAGSSSCKVCTCAGLSYQHRGTPRGIVSSFSQVLLVQKELEGTVCLDLLWLSPFQMKQETEGWASLGSVCLFGRSNSTSSKKELSLNSGKQIHACKFSTDSILWVPGILQPPERHQGQQQKCSITVYNWLNHMKICSD